MTYPEIPFIDLHAQRKYIGQSIEDAILKVTREGRYIMGPEITELENQLAEFCGAKHAISCSNGTDALALVLMAKGVKPGDAIFVPSFTFVATAEVVAWLGATPVFVDVQEDSFNMCPQSLTQALQDAQEQGLKPEGIIAVDLFGQPADYDTIIPIADKHNMWVMADAAQSFGSSIANKKAGTFGLATATSFFPAKPLGCYGDGGAIFTNNDDLAETIISMRVHGQGNDKYDNIRIGMNGRLDTIQAAVLLEKLKVFPDELIARQNAADYYSEHLKGSLKTPQLPKGTTSAWAQYTLILPDNVDRNVLIQNCKDKGVPIMVYYPIPLGKQKAYKHYPSVSTGTPIADKLADTVISLPMHGYLATETQDYIINVVKESLKTSEIKKA